MTSVSIDRMTLNAPCLGRAGGERLARLVLDGLAGATRPAGGSVDSLSITLNAGSASDPEAMAGQIVRELLRRFDRME